MRLKTNNGSTYINSPKSGENKIVLTDAFKEKLANAEGLSLDVKDDVVTDIEVIELATEGFE